MSPQFKAIAMLNNMFESFDGRPVDNAVLTRSDYQFLVEALVPEERSHGPNGRAVAWVATTEKGTVLHMSEIDGWKVEAVAFEPSSFATSHRSPEPKPAPNCPDDEEDQSRL